MKKQGKKQDVVLVKATAVAEVIRQAEAVRRDLEIDSLDAHLTGCPLDLVRAARYAVRHHGITVDAAVQAVKLQAQKRRDQIAREDAERRKNFQFESEKSKAEKAFSEALEKVNMAIEAESDPFLKGFLLSAIPEEPAILRDGSAPVKVRKTEKAEKTTTVKAPRGNSRTATIEAALPGTIADISSKTGESKTTLSKYVTHYVKAGKWVKDSNGTISLA